MALATPPSTQVLTCCRHTCKNSWCSMREENRFNPTADMCWMKNTLLLLLLLYTILWWCMWTTNLYKAQTFQANRPVTWHKKKSLQTRPIAVPYKICICSSHSGQPYYLWLIFILTYPLTWTCTARVVLISSVASYLLFRMYLYLSCFTYHHCILCVIAYCLRLMHLSNICM